MKIKRLVALLLVAVTVVGVATTVYASPKSEMVKMTDTGTRLTKLTKSFKDKVIATPVDDAVFPVVKLKRKPDAEIIPPPVKKEVSSVPDTDDTDKGISVSEKNIKISAGLKTSLKGLTIEGKAYTAPLEDIDTNPTAEIVPPPTEIPQTEPVDTPVEDEATDKGIVADNSKEDAVIDSEMLPEVIREPDAEIIPPPAEIPQIASVETPAETDKVREPDAEIIMPPVETVTDGDDAVVSENTDITSKLNLRDKKLAVNPVAEGLIEVEPIHRKPDAEIIPPPSEIPIMK